MQNNENKTFWAPNQKDLNSSSYGSIMRPGGVWPGQLLKGSLDLFRDPAEDLSARSIVSDYYSPVSSKASNGPVLDQVEKGKRHENVLGCRLFGIDLWNNSNDSSLEKGAPSTEIVADHANNASASAGKCDQDLLKSCKDKKQVQSDISPNDGQNKQSFSASTRTRTKVLALLFFASQSKNLLILITS